MRRHRVLFDIVLAAIWIITTGALYAMFEVTFR